MNLIIEVGFVLNVFGEVITLINTFFIYYQDVVLQKNFFVNKRGKRNFFIKGERKIEVVSVFCLIYRLLQDMLLVIKMYKKVVDVSGTKGKILLVGIDAVV